MDIAGTFNLDGKLFVHRMVAAARTRLIAFYDEHNR
jgi:hypothetical protein